MRLRTNWSVQKDEPLQVLRTTKAAPWMPRPMPGPGRMVRDAGKGQGSQKERTGGGCFCPPSGSEQTQQEGEGEMRLIDADLLKEHISSYAGMFTDEGFMVRLEAVLCGIDFQPTAYDVKAVVRELEEAKFVCYMKDDKEASGYNDGLSEAIRIVKRGGRNE